jgi:hypothetical protein
METTFENSMRTDGQPPREGKVARAIETKTAKLPSDLFLWGAMLAVGGSLAMQIVGMATGGRKQRVASAPISTFIGQWAPTILLLGVYNKIVKVSGSDRSGRPAF